MRVKVFTAKPTNSVGWVGVIGPVCRDILLARGVGATAEDAADSATEVLQSILADVLS